MQSDIGKQQWVTGFYCVVGWLIVYQDGNYLYPGQLAWQDPVHSRKAGSGKVMTLESLHLHQPER